MVFAADCLAGRVALVTGAAGGIGGKTVEALLAVGASVVATDLETLRVSGENVLSLAHDVTRLDDWKKVVAQAVARFGRLDILVNNAAIYRPCALENETIESYQQTSFVNQGSVLLGMQSVTEPMKNAGGGSIINISSGAGLYGTPGAIAYSASKWAVRGMTRVAAIELAPYRIRVNSIHPAAVNTPMLDILPERPSGQSTLIKRIMQPEEVAGMVVFLASDASGYSTGAEFLCDGGYRA
jgi:3alpha(or 20beta)-hydroxysteroid dehydrogenase